LKKEKKKPFNIKCGSGREEALVFNKFSFGQLPPHLYVVVDDRPVCETKDLMVWHSSGVEVYVLP
jgi:hypothetical protein